VAGAARSARGEGGESDEIRDALVGRGPVNWGPYAAAIGRWEAILGREAPAPTSPTGRDGAHRLSAEFVEWMMGLPIGWVTDPSIGIKRNEQLKALGNGVVPQQALLALSIAWAQLVEFEAAA
jgi:DNA (cytosine-5)-methyltransferase 1